MANQSRSMYITTYLWGENLHHMGEVEPPSTSWLQACFPQQCANMAFFPLSPHHMLLAQQIQSIQGYPYLKYFHLKFVGMQCTHSICIIPTKTAQHVITSTQFSLLEMRVLLCCWDVSKSTTHRAPRCLFLAVAGCWLFWENLFK